MDGSELESTLREIVGEEEERKKSEEEQEWSDAATSTSIEAKRMLDQDVQELWEWANS